MDKMNLIAWANEGSINIPSFLITHFKSLKLNESELVLILQVISFQNKGNDFPTPEELSNRMTSSADICANMLRSLVQKGFIEISDEYSSEGIRYEKYSLEPLWEKVIEQFLLIRKSEDHVIKSTSESDLYICFETEFGRPLSPFEIETLSMWLDDDRHDTIIIKAALREAVISGKLNFRYIDRILFEWKRNGIKTVEQAKSYGLKFRQKPRQAVNQKPSTNPVPIYNWLEDVTGEI
ncbi:DnaD domain-containing protein [Bacillus sp. CGMCC 1.16607]|uniref:DnaD domain-containing protein n=1 Tax=Bacillus sp. CGMCC 1.16607 TaxID=3351842 RepID=UPI003636CC1E